MTEAGDGLDPPQNADLTTRNMGVDPPTSMVVCNLELSVDHSLVSSAHDRGESQLGQVMKIIVTIFGTMAITSQGSACSSNYQGAEERGPGVNVNV